MAATSDVIMLLWLPWKPIKCHVTMLSVVSILDTYYTCLFHVNWLNTFENRGGVSPIDTPPLMPSCNFFSSCLRKLNEAHQVLEQERQDIQSFHISYVQEKTSLYLSNF